MKMAISTHALTWSATFKNQIVKTEKKFQLTHSRGVRPTPIRRRQRSTVRFQLTHSRGVRLKCRKENENDVKFQLTHSRGVRL